MAYGYDVAVWVAAHTAVKGVLLDAEEDAPTIQVFSATDVLLASAEIDPAASAVDEDGNLTLAIATQELSAPAGGTAAYAALYDGLSPPVARAKYPCQQGSAAVAGYCVLNTLTITAGQPVTFQPITIAAGATM